jgi:ligand-binding sensor domain-containing protein
MKKLYFALVFCYTQTIFAQTVSQHYNMANSPLPSDVVRCLAFNAAQNTLWIGTDNGLASVDLTNNNWQVFTTENSGLLDNQIRAVAIDLDNRVWVGTYTAGLAMYNGNTWQAFTTNNSLLNDSFVRNIYIDTQQQKWLSTSGGVSVLDAMGNWTIYFFNTPAVTLNNVTDIVFDANQQPWFSTINTGLVGYNNDDFFALTGANSNLPDNTILAMALGNGNTIWLASPFHGLTAFVPPNSFQTYTTLNSNIPSNYLNTVETNTKQQVLIGTPDTGLVIFTIPTNTWLNVNTNNSALPNNHISSIALQTDTEAWLGTQNGVVLCRFTAPFVDGIGEEVVPEITVYPNPISNYLSVQTNSSVQNSIQLLDGTGRVIYATTNKSAIFNTQNLPNACYWVVVQSANNRTVKKVVKIGN